MVGRAESATPMRSAPVVAAGSEGVAIKVMSAGISAADNDIVIWPISAVVRSAVGTGIAVVIIRPAVPNIAAIQISRPRAAAQCQRRAATYDGQR